MSPMSLEVWTGPFLKMLLNLDPDLESFVAEADVQPEEGLVALR